MQGDDPDTIRDEGFNPLAYGMSDWGTWFQGEIIGEYVLANSNLFSYLVGLRDENSIIPESGLSFDSTAAPETQLRSQLCVCISNTTVQPKFCVILSGIIKSSSLRVGLMVVQC